MNKSDKDAQIKAAVDFMLISRSIGECVERLSSQREHLELIMERRERWYGLDHPRMERGQVNTLNFELTQAIQDAARILELVRMVGPLDPGQRERLEARRAAGEDVS